MDELLKNVIGIKYVDIKKLKLSFFFTYFLGFLAHGFSFFNLQLSHDCLAEFMLSYNWKIRLGRYLKPIYDIFFGKFISLPWINGLMLLFWLSLSAYLVVEMFNIQRKSHIAIICGIMSTNITVIALNATYLHDACANMFCLFITILGVYFWSKLFEAKNNRNKLLLIVGSILSVFISLAIYQAYISVYISLVLIISILKLLDSYEIQSWKHVWRNDIIGAIICLLGGGLYYIGLKIVLSITGLTLNEGNYNSLTNLSKNGEPLLDRITKAFTQFFDYFLHAKGFVYPDSFPRIIFILLFVTAMISFAFIIVQLIHKKVSIINVFSSILFLFLLPFSMNLMRLLNEYIHDLMVYAYWFIYIFFFLLIIKVSKINHRKLLETFSSLLLCILIIINVQVANATYADKALSQQATFSVMTRIVDKIESFDEYIPGDTPVTFIGTPSSYLKEFQDFVNFSRISGIDVSTITYQQVYPKYISLILKLDMNVVLNGYLYDNNILDSFNLNKMPCYPAKDSIQFVNGVVIVKFE